MSYTRYKNTEAFTNFGLKQKDDYNLLYDEPPAILEHSNTDFCPLIYELIPAHGCSYECKYCNVYSLKKKKTFYPVKVFAKYPELLDRLLLELKDSGKKPVYYLSPKTDIFQPALVESGITEELIELLIKNDAQFILVTKGRLPNGHILEKLIESGNNCRVLISYGMKNEYHAKILEPNAASLSERMSFAKLCVQNSIPAMGVIEPILPLADLKFVNDIITQFTEMGIDHFALDFARISMDTLEEMISILPELEELRSVYTDPDAIKQNFETGAYYREVITRYAPSKKYLTKNFQTMETHATKNNATISICNFFGIQGINNSAYKKGYLCFGIHDVEKANQYLAL